MLRRAATLFVTIVTVLPAIVTAQPLRVERVVMLMRHGLRAPIDGEVPAGTRTAVPWPRWPVPAEYLTPHGATMIRLHAQADRQWLVHQGIFPPRGCPKPGMIRIWANTPQRTIATGNAFAEGFAPGCGISTGHLGSEEVDPLFEPLRARATSFDAAKAIASINAYTGGIDRLADRYRPTIVELNRILDCGATEECSPVTASVVRTSEDGHGIDLSGPIRTVSGTAQVLLLQYAEGLAGRGTTWPQVDAPTLVRIGALHSALFDVFTRPPYMAAHQAGPLGRHLISRLTEKNAPSFELLVGHDTNVTALAAALRITLLSPGYAPGDVAPGGALAFEVRKGENAARFIKITYRTQSPEMLRNGKSGVMTRSIPLKECKTGPDRSCPIADLIRILQTRIAK